MITRFAQVLALGVCAVAAAQDHQPARPVANSATKLEVVKTGLFVVTGLGGNTVVRLSGNGIVLVDGKLPGHYGELVGQVRRLADELPIRLLITTDYNEVHTGTNADFVLHGVPVLAQANVKEYLTASNHAPSSVVPPSEVFQDEHTIRLGGVTIQLRYFGPAHTSGDAVVFFPDLKVVAVGDLFTRETPSVDFAAGGSLAGWSAVLNQVMQLDFDTVIPGSGPVTDRAGLQGFKSRIDLMLARATH